MTHLPRSRVGFMPLVATLLLTLAATPSAQARLVEDDLATPGDRALTRNTRSGLEWLDLNQTLMRSYNDVANDPELKELGFKHARAKQVRRLFRVSGITLNEALDTTDLANAERFIALLGQTETFFPGTNISSLSGGMHEQDPFSPERIAYSNVAVLTDPGTGDLSAASTYNAPSSDPFNTKDFVPNFSGHYLIRHAKGKTLIRDLMQTVKYFQVHRGISRALRVKLYIAKRLARAGRYKPAMGIMRAFIHHARAQSGKHLTKRQSNELVKSAEVIVRALHREKRRGH